MSSSTFLYPKIFLHYPFAEGISENINCLAKMSLSHCSMESWQVLGGESSSGGAQLCRCSIARRSILRGLVRLLLLLLTWPGHGAPAAASLQPSSTLSTLQLSQQLWTLASWLALEFDSKKAVKLFLLSSWFWSDTLRECCTLILGQHWLCPGHSLYSRAL